MRKHFKSMLSKSWNNCIGLEGGLINSAKEKNVAKEMSFSQFRKFLDDVVISKNLLKLNIAYMKVVSMKNNILAGK